ncbi:MAG: Uridine monophosphate kinase, partial [uncultured Microvirga sp.]
DEAIPSRAGETVGRGARGAGRLLVPPANARGPGPGHRERDRGRVRDRARDRRRQHHPRRPDERRRVDRPRDRGRHGHVGDRDELPRARDGAERGGRFRPDHVGGFNADDLRNLRPPARAPSPGEGAGAGSGRRHRQPLLHDRHVRRPARGGTALRCRAQGDAGGRSLLGRPQKRWRGRPLRSSQPRRGDRPRPQGDGHGRFRARPREPVADHRRFHSQTKLRHGDTGWDGAFDDRCPL